MNIFKSSILTFVALTSVMTFTACDDDDDINVVGEPFTVPGAFFKAQYDNEVVLGETDTEFAVTIYRSDSEGVYTANIASAVTSSAPNAASAFNVSPTVTFADGENTATILVSFDVKNLEPITPYELKISVADGADTPYTLNSVNYTVSYVPWTDLGMGLYTDYFVGTFFKVENVTYEVQVLEHPQMAGLYRIVNPYGAAYPYNEPGDYDDSQDYYLYINATNPNAVYFCDRDGKPAHFFSGMNWGYGEFVMTTMATYYLKKGDSASAAEYYGTLKNGHIYIPAILAAMTEYNDGGLYDSTIEDGEWMLELPGAGEPTPAALARPVKRAPAKFAFENLTPARL